MRQAVTAAPPPPPAPRRLRWLALTALSAACATPLARPLPVQPSYVYKEVSARYRAFFPTADDASDPDLQHDQGLLRPRFGLPTLTRGDAPFEILVLERGAADAPARPRAALIAPGSPLDAAALERCSRGAAEADCHPLVLSERSRSAVSQSTTLVSYQAQPAGALPQGAYDLYLASAIDAPTRVPKAVWARDQDPDQPAPLRVAHLSDLHVGKRIHDTPDIASADGDLVTARLKRVLGEVNAQHPDLVVVTGDLVNRGQERGLALQAQALLLQLNAPVLVVMGNHDIEFDLRKRSPRRYGEGWSNFARAFHPYLHFQVRLGGYDFVGFDSGPSERSPRVLTRGLSPATLDQLADDVRSASASGQRGVVFFSHAPTRAALLAGLHPRGTGVFGHMRHGNTGFERILLTAAQRGQRVLHLSGHTHWSDVFESGPRQGRLAFSRWPTRSLSLCPRAIQGKAALITTQAASHSGLFFKENARGYGFSLVTLGDGPPTVATRRFGAPQPPCR